MCNVWHMQILISYLSEYFVPIRQPTEGRWQEMKGEMGMSCNKGSQADMTEIECILTVSLPGDPNFCCNLFRYMYVYVLINNKSAT